jgi:membrane fusion protein, multidrug efflux system
LVASFSQLDSQKWSGILAARFLRLHELTQMQKNLFVFPAVAVAMVFSGCEKKSPPAAPPQVQVVTVTLRDVPIYQQWIGTLDGYPNAQIRAQVSGYLTRQDYKEGGAVKNGDLLFEIDPRPFQAVLDQALGRLAQDKAQQGKTELDVKRFTPLAKEQAISQEQLDDAVQANLAAGASIQADQAAVESAKLNLGFCRIISPVDGIAGTALAQIGDLVGPGTAVLTTVSTIDPMRVYFSISEQSYLAFYHQYTNAAERAAQQEQMQLDLILSDGSTYPYPGKWYFTSRQIDANTGTLQVAGLFPNPDLILRPGQYAQVRAKTETRHGAILLPQRVVTQLQGSYQVTTVDAQNKAHLKTVQVGPQIGSDWLIENGLEPNDRVVAEGVLKAKEGTEVNPQPYNEATASTNNAAPVTNK